MFPWENFKELIQQVNDEVNLLPNCAQTTMNARCGSHDVRITSVITLRNRTVARNSNKARWVIPDSFVN